jgi:hypothetical protein
MPDFTLHDLRNDIDPKVRDIICDVILSWARLDSLISQLVLLAFGLALDGGTILLGTMDSRNKLDKLKNLYDHHGMSEAADSIGNLQQWVKAFVDVRNTIAHHTCAGSWKSDPDMLVFAPVRAMQGQLNHVEVQHIPLREMNRSADFAMKAADAIQKITGPLTERSAVRPLEPPAFLPLKPPSHRKNGGKGKPQPREASRK